MQAVWYEQNGPADQVLTYGQIEDPQVGPDEVRVRLHSSGVNPSDTKRRGGTVMAFPRIIPHSDGAGVIERVGSNVPVERIGERVWLWNAQFGRALGTAAEYIVVPSAQAVPLPENVDFATGACLGIPALTAHRCLFADGPIVGQTILISGGAGAVGNAAVQLAKWAGATVITTVSSPEKAQIARDSGADYVLDYTKEDVVARINEITNGVGVQRIVEVAFGRNLAINLEVLQQNGTIATYGSDAEREPRIPFYDLMYKDMTVRFVLVYLLTDEARLQGITDITTALVEQKFRPIIAQSFPLSQTAQAHQAVESGKMLGNVVIEF
jgi:NADPH:quinone reductase